MLSMNGELVVGFMIEIFAKQDGLLPSFPDCRLDVATTPPSVGYMF